VTLGDLKGAKKAPIDDVIKSSRNLAGAIASIVNGLKTNNDDELSGALKKTTEEVKNVVVNTKGAAIDVSDDALRQNLLDSCKSVTAATSKYVATIKAKKRNPKSKQIEQQTSEASKGVADAISQIVTAAKDLGAKDVEDNLQNDLDAQAEAELLKTAKAIQDAANSLIAAKNARPKKVNVGEADVSEQIFDSAAAIARAAGVLVEAASVAQREIVSKGKQSVYMGKVYKRDPTWAQGLISAAREVASAVKDLVGEANKAANGGDETGVIAAAKAVSTATSHLVTAAKVKSDPNSPGQAKLAAAAKAVTAATNALVEAAVAFKESSNDAGPEDLDEGKLERVKEMEARMKILRLEKELELARTAQTNLHKKRYQ